MRAEEAATGRSAGADKIADMPERLVSQSKIKPQEPDNEVMRQHGYLLMRTVGEGSYAKVKKAQWQLRDNMNVAIKIINRRKAPPEFQKKFLPRELDVMKQLKHKNIIRMYETIHANNKVYISMELAGHGDLLEFVKLRGAVDEALARRMFAQLIDAIDYLHSNNIVHRDLKCENILLDSNNDVKVTDFGFSRFYSRPDLSRTFCGSAAYAAPEVLQGIPYDPKTYDIWSLGIILYIMVNGSMPYDDSNPQQMVFDQTRRRLGFSKKRKISQEVKDLILAILRPEPTERATLDQIRRSTWLKPYIDSIQQS